MQVIDANSNINYGSLSFQKIYPTSRDALHVNRSKNYSRAQTSHSHKSHDISNIKEEMQYHSPPSSHNIVLKKQLNALMKRRLGFLRQLLNEDSKFIYMPNSKQIDFSSKPVEDHSKVEKMIKDWKDYENKQKMLHNKFVNNMDKRNYEKDQEESSIDKLPNIVDLYDKEENMNMNSSELDIDGNMYNIDFGQYIEMVKDTKNNINKN